MADTCVHVHPIIKILNLRFFEGIWIYAADSTMSASKVEDTGMDADDELPLHDLPPYEDLPSCEYLPPCDDDLPPCEVCHHVKIHNHVMYDQHIIISF